MKKIDDLYPEVWIRCIDCKEPLAKVGSIVSRITHNSNK